MSARIAVFATMAVASTMAMAQQTAPPEAIAFARSVASVNAFELQSSELAKERAQASEVKSFAEKMAADHGKAAKEFKAALEAAKVSLLPRDQLDVKGKVTLAKLRNAHAGVPFDRAYINAQLNAYREAVSLFRNYSKSGGTEELKSFAQKTLPTLEQHLSMVEQLNSQAVAGLTGSGSRALSPPADTPPRNRKP